MAPRKKVEEKPVTKSGTNEAADTILKYLRQQNRPYSANDVSANLHNKVTKATAAKILKDLHERNQVAGRAAGKQIVYHALQKSEDSRSPEQLATLDAATNDLRSSAANLLASIKTLRSTLTSLSSTLSTTDLICNVQALEAERTDISARLENLKAGKSKRVTEGEREEVERNWKKWSGAATKRKAISWELWKLIEENLPDKESKNEVRESLGFDE